MRPDVPAAVAPLAQADAAVRSDATRAAVAQIADGREVAVEPIAAGMSTDVAPANADGTAFARDQADLHRAGFIPSLPQSELEAATQELYEGPADHNQHRQVGESAQTFTTETAEATGAAMGRTEGAPAPVAPTAAATDVAEPIRSETIPNGIASYRPSELGLDAQRFQFKAGGDEAGVTERLRGVTQWDPIKAGMALVWRDRAGKSWIVDGHQRLALAKRIEAEDPAQQPQLLARTLDESDGVSAAMARTVAAMKNIAEGTGTAIDAAKVIRDHPEFAGELPQRSELVRQARGLVNLDPESFRMVVNDIVPPNYAAIVGRLVPSDPRMQGALLRLIAKTEPANAVQAESIVRQGIDAGNHVETQESLFGSHDVAENLYIERAKVLDRALKTLRRDRTVFGTLVKEEGTLEAAGNRLAREINERRMTADGQALQILQTLANRSGPIGEALKSAARRSRDDGNYAGAIRDFVEFVRRSASSGDLARLADGIERGAPHAGNEGGAGLVDTGIGAEPVSDGEELDAAAEIRHAIEPAAERGAEGRPQLVLPGTERSARQAAAAGEQQDRGMMRPALAQQQPGGLFAPRAAESPSLFADLDQHIAQAEQQVSALSLTPEDHAEIGAANDTATTAERMEQAYAQAGACLNGVV
jgi:hypothetical protein